MKIKASGRSALILAAGLWVCFAGPSQAAAASGSAATTSTTATPVALNKYAKHTSHHWKKYAHHKSGDVAQKLSDANKAAATDVADADKSSTLQSEIPLSVANANAQLPASDSSAGDAAKAMSVRAANILQSAPDNPADAQPATETQVVAADQLNDVDRALRPSDPPAATLATASAEPPAGAGRAVSSSESTWDQTSLIGKIFVGFGALLTMASAARMFMA